MANKQLLNIEIIDKPFSTVFFEIVGKCNAKCSYCITGNGTQTGSFVDVDKFKESIQLLYSKKLVDENTNFGLLNWGEPLLHPKFSQIVEFMSNSNIKFSLSTNLSVIPKNITKDSFLSLTNIVISMPGFSQESYSKIHGFNFFRILENIHLLMKFIPKEKIIISYHIYQFNISEIKIAQEYFKSLGIKVRSIFATFNDYKMARKYIYNSFSATEMQKISKELLLFYVDDLLGQMPEDYTCPQLNCLTIDENCNIIRCCGVPKDSKDSKDYKISEISLIDKQQLENRDKADICKECYKERLAYWGHNLDKVTTEFMHRILK